MESQQLGGASVCVFSFKVSSSPSPKAGLELMTDREITHRLLYPLGSQVPLEPPIGSLTLLETCWPPVKGQTAHR